MILPLKLVKINCLFSQFNKGRIFITAKIIVIFKAHSQFLIQNF